MKRGLFRLIRNASLLAPAWLAAPLQASDAAPLTLAEEWAVHREPDVCYLRGAFGAGDTAATLIIARTLPTPWFDLSIAGPVLPEDEMGARIDLQFSPHEAPTSYAVFPVEAGARQLTIRDVRFDGITRGDPRQAEQIDEQAVDSLTVNISGHRSFRFETGPMAGQMQQLRDCVNTLVRSWGHDPVALATIRQGPVPANYPGSWVTPADNPADRPRTPSSSTIKFRADVGTAGQVESCAVLASSGTESLDRLTCQLISARARFRPAVDMAGQPIRAFFISAVRWVQF